MPRIEPVLVVIGEINANSLGWAGNLLAIAVPAPLLLAIYTELGRQNAGADPGARQSRRLLHLLLCICLCLSAASWFINSQVARTQGQRLKRAEAIAADAQDSIDRERRGLLGLQKSLTLRDVRLPSDFDPTVLRSIHGINVELSSSPDPEPRKVGESIRAVIEFAGWNVVGTELTDEPLKPGILIKIPEKTENDDRSREASDAILSILRKNRVDAATEEAALPPNTLRIEIGADHGDSSAASVDVEEAPAARGG